MHKTEIIHTLYDNTSMSRYSLFVLKVPLNTKQTDKQTVSLLCVTGCGIVWAVAVDSSVLIATTVLWMCDGDILANPVHLENGR